MIDIRVDPSSTETLHQQIVDQVRHRMAVGRLQPGDRLPPVRALAKQLGINVNTAAKAYDELGRMGLLAMSPGRGTFVAGGEQTHLAAFREDRLRSLLGRAVQEALTLGYSLEQIEGALALQWAQWRELRTRERGEPVQKEFLQSRPDVGIMGSHDLALDLLIGQIRRTHPDLSVISSNVGSIAGLIALERGDADAAGCHLLDEETGEYNLPFVRRILPGEQIVLVNLVYREQGLIVARGNPKGIRGLGDLARSDVVLVNRQRGAGTRVLLDLRLRELRISPEQVAGYNHEVDTHTAVAAAIASGSADVGMGILSASKALGLDFVPLERERYDLAIRASDTTSPSMEALLGALRSDSYKSVVREMGGYDTSDTGKVVGETL